MKEGDIVGLIQRKRTVTVIVGRVQAYGQPDDHYGVVRVNGSVSWHYPDSLYLAGETHANGVTVLSVYDADQARPALQAALGRKQVQTHLKARATMRYAADGKTLLWKAASARNEELLRLPGAGKGATEKSSEPWKLSTGDGSELGHEMVAYLDDGGIRTWLLERLKAHNPARHRLFTLREDLGAPFADIARLFGIAEPTARWHFYQARAWMRQETAKYHERRMLEASA